MNPSEFSKNYLLEVIAQYTSVVIVYETEAVSVVGGGEIIPYAIGNIPFLENRYHIVHPIFARGDIGVAYSAELAAPEYLIGISLDKSVSMGILIYPIKRTVGRN